MGLYISHRSNYTKEFEIVNKRKGRKKCIHRLIFITGESTVTHVQHCTLKVTVIFLYECICHFPIATQVQVHFSWPLVEIGFEEIEIQVHGMLRLVFV